MAEMTKEVIVASCKANGGYAAPLLNDQLFLHCKGFADIRNLGEYTNVKVLWLEQNAIRRLDGLESMQELVSLFVQNNMIHSLRSLTTPLRNLRVINLSHNYLSSLAGLGAACPQLETLQASHNRIASLEACEDLFLLANTLTSVDLSFNRITTYAATCVEVVEGEQEETEEAEEDEQVGREGRIADEVRVVTETANVDSTTTEELQRQGQQLDAGKTDPLVIVSFFKRLPNVSVVYLQGNAISHGLKHYRRNMVLHLPQLSYLDERPVFPEERRVVEAWGRGGGDAEAEERAAIREEKKRHLNSCVRVLTDKMEASRELRDRLTKQWDAKRAEEMEQLNQLRRDHRDARAAVEFREQSQRECLEKEQQAARWDWEEAFADALAPLTAAESQHRHQYEQALAVAAVTAEVEKEIATAAEACWAADAASTAPHLTDVPKGVDNDSQPLHPESRPADREAVLAELLKSDDDILREMEDEIESVLNSLEPSFYGEGKRKASRSFASGGTSLGDVGVAAADRTAAAAAAPPPPQASAEDRTAAATTVNRRVASTTAKMERAVHAAVGQVSAKLREDQAARGAAESLDTSRSVWARFDEWERRQQRTV